MKVGLQVYTVRNHFKAAPYETLKQVKEEGYKYIEMANHDAYHDVGTGFNVPVDEFKKAVEELGIKVVGAHIMPADEKETIEPFYKDLDHFKKIIAYYNELEVPYLSIPIDFYSSYDYLMSRCEVYNNLGKVCKENGITLLYHNHWHEFQRINGKVILDTLMENTDPEYLGMELDAYWTIRGAFDPAEKIRTYGNRIKLLHEKDFPLKYVQEMNSWMFIDQDKPVDYDGYLATIKPHQFVEIGDGMIKVQDVIDAGNEFGVEYILIEQDFSELDEIESIRKSMSNFKRMRDLTWD
ncbi:MAG: sugar phosphate isomerase/epimerase [Lachnospiraceae bacterium]|nr:sugar phosphate isomerase/epimerase [Lachnospiraceae bacterium]